MNQLIPSVVLALLTWQTPVVAQVQGPVGNGLRGDYYAGVNWAHLRHSRIDNSIQFDWRGTPPVRGVAPENFTVRWTGWLVPPVTGRYVLYLNVDDGVSLWLDEQELFTSWRGQSQHSFQVPVQLQAGHAYALRLDYLQYVQLGRIHLAWELPPSPEEQSSWRTLWGITETPLLGSNRRPETIPTQYLFTHWPATTKLAVRRAKPATPLPAGGRLVPAGFRPPALRVKLTEVLIKPPKSRRHTNATSPRADTLAARLAKGQELILRTLYFEQSKAELPLLVQASLDTLAQALRNYPTLRLEIQGHTDNQGDSTLNRQLSQRRAEAVCRYLVSRGVPNSYLQPRGLGGTQPIADNRLPAERPRNRRVVLRPLP